MTSRIIVIKNLAEEVTDQIGKKSQVPGIVPE